jgi:hypothetical protein
VGYTDAEGRTLAQLCKEILAEVGNPLVAAEKLLATLPEDATTYRAVIEEMAPGYIRVLAQVWRNHNRQAAERNDREAGERVPQSKARPGPSRFTSAVPIYQRLLNQPECIDEGEWKPLGHCTRDDVAALVDKYTEKARQLFYVRRKYEMLVAALDHYGAKTVADLPMEAVLEAMRTKTGGSDDA